MGEQQHKKDSVLEEQKEIVDNENVEIEDQEILEADEVIDEHSENDDQQVEQLNVEDLLKEIDRLKKDNQEVSDRMLRLQAEFDNFKKRTQREKVADRQYKSQELVTELLPSLDNFERALQVEVTETNKNIIDGISMVYNQIKEALISQGVEEIETVGKEFDPNIHHAVMQVEEEDKDSNIILEELQKGYMLKDRVIRPAMVKVNK